MSTIAMSQIAPERIHEFDTRGFTVLESVIAESDREALRQACAEEMAKIDRENAQAGRPPTTKYFFPAFVGSPAVRAFTFSPVMETICHAFLGDTAYLVFEQFVVKSAEKGGKFAWHQDSGYVPTPHRPYLTCWCTLDEVTE